MKKIVFTLLLFASFFGCKKSYQPRALKTITLAIDKTPFNIRAITLSNKIAYFTTSKGRIIGYIKGTENILDSSNKYFDSIQPNIRATAFNGKDFFTLNIETPAYLFKNSIDNKGLVSNPTLVYKEEGKKVFYDAMAFFDEQNGIAIGDPTDKCLSVLLTKDGGNSWCKVACDVVPEVFEGEAAFAASNTNIAIVGSNAWIITGGKKSRIFHTTDKGETWKVYNTPIVQGSNTTGGYTVAFYDALNGIIMGGDYLNKKENIGNKAITNDGGKTWKLVSEGATPGYISCVQYIPKTNGFELIAVSTEGIYFSNDKGNSWLKVHNEGFYTIRFDDKNTAWLAGNKKIAKLTIPNK